MEVLHFLFGVFGGFLITFHQTFFSILFPLSWFLYSSFLFSWFSFVYRKCHCFVPLLVSIVCITLTKQLLSLLSLSLLWKNTHTHKDWSFLWFLVLACLNVKISNRFFFINGRTRFCNKRMQQRLNFASFWFLEIELKQKKYFFQRKDCF